MVCAEIPLACLRSGVSLSALGWQVHSLPMSSDTKTALLDTQTAILHYKTSDKATEPQID